MNFILYMKVVWILQKHHGLRLKPDLMRASFYQIVTSSFACTVDSSPNFSNPFVGIFLFFRLQMHADNSVPKQRSVPILLTKQIYKQVLQTS